MGNEKKFGWLEAAAIGAGVLVARAHIKNREELAREEERSRVLRDLLGVALASGDTEKVKSTLETFAAMEKVRKEEEAAKAKEAADKRAAVINKLDADLTKGVRTLRAQFPWLHK